MRHVSVILMLLSVFGAGLLVTAGEPEGEGKAPDAEAAKAEGVVELGMEDVCVKLVDETIAKMGADGKRSREELDQARAGMVFDLSEAYRRVVYWQNRSAALREYMAAVKSDREGALKMLEKKEPLAGEDLKVANETLKRARLSFIRSEAAGAESLAALKKMLIEAGSDLDVDCAWKLGLPDVLPKDIDGKIEEFAKFFTADLLGQDKAACFGKEELRDINLKVKALPAKVNEFREFVVRIAPLRDQVILLSNGYREGKALFTDLQRVRALLLDAEDSVVRSRMEAQTMILHLAEIKKIIEAASAPAPEPAP